MQYAPARSYFMTWSNCKRKMVDVSVNRTPLTQSCSMILKNNDRRTIFLKSQPLFGERFVFPRGT